MKKALLLAAMIFLFNPAYECALVNATEETETSAIDLTPQHSPIQIVWAKATKLPDGTIKDMKAEVRNVSGKAITGLVIATDFRDPDGRRQGHGWYSEDLWGTGPNPRGKLEPGAALQITDNSGMKPRPGLDLALEVWVDFAEFEDGTNWGGASPSAMEIKSPRMMGVIERKRLRELYEKQGLDALLDELKK